jgi:hypothetical protein
LYSIFFRNELIFKFFGKQKFIMEIKKILVVLEVLILFSNVVLAQESPFNPQIEILGGLLSFDLKTIGYVWVWILCIAFILISASLIIKNRAVLFGGVAFLYASIIFALIAIVLPVFSKPTVTYEKCTSMFYPGNITIINLTIPRLFYAGSCIFTGYAPENLEWLTVTTFIIFGICLPLALLFSLFFSFVPTFMITNENARRVIAFVGTLFAFRGFFASFFIQALEYGFVGVGGLMIGTLFTGLVWRVCEKFVSPLGIKTKEALKIMKLGYYQELEEELAMLQKAKLAAQKTGDTEAEAMITKRINKLQELLGKVEKGKA